MELFTVHLLSIAYSTECRQKMNRQKMNNVQSSIKGVHFYVVTIIFYCPFYFMSINWCVSQVVSDL